MTATPSPWPPEKMPTIEEVFAEFESLVHQPKLTNAGSDPMIRNELESLLYIATRSGKQIDTQATAAIATRISSMQLDSLETRDTSRNLCGILPNILDSQMLFRAFCQVLLSINKPELLHESGSRLQNWIYAERLAPPEETSIRKPPFSLNDAMFVEALRAVKHDAELAKWDEGKRTEWEQRFWGRLCGLMDEQKIPALNHLPQNEWLELYFFSIFAEDSPFTELGFTGMIDRFGLQTVEQAMEAVPLFAVENRPTFERVKLQITQNNQSETNG